MFCLPSILKSISYHIKPIDKDIPRGLDNLNCTVVFVSHHLHRYWPKIKPPDGDMPLAEVPPFRLHQLENIWVVSTYLRLKRFGLPVQISDHLVPGCVNVCCEYEVLRDADAHHAYIVLTLGDRDHLGWGDFHLVQSPVQAERPRTCLIDHWPQPGLVRRKVERGSRIERIGYMGFAANLASSFRGGAFRRALTELGVELVIREDPVSWHDYSDLDLCLGVRDLSSFWIRIKPATKLVQAWLTGVPALLGPEPAYQYWGDDGEDYFEVRTPADVLAVVKRLKKDPALYERVRRRGAEKGQSHDERSVCRQWQAVLSGPIRKDFERWRRSSPVGWAWRRMCRTRQRWMAPVLRRFFYLRAKGWRGLMQKFQLISSAR